MSGQTEQTIPWGQLEQDSRKQTLMGYLIPNTSEGIAEDPNGRKNPVDCLPLSKTSPDHLRHLNPQAWQRPAPSTSSGKEEEGRRLHIQHHFQNLWDFLQTPLDIYDRQDPASL